MQNGILGRRGRTLGALRWKMLAFVVPLLVGSCVVAPAPSLPPPAAWHTTTLGVCEDYPEETRTLAHARADLEAAHAAGAQVLRIAFGWDSMEPAKGTYDWSFWDEFVRMATDDYGLRLIPYVCYTPKWAASDSGENYWRSPPKDPQDFARFMDVIVRRYSDRIHSWELWNEPDNRAYWLGTPEQFTALVRAGGAAVRAADPSATIVLGGIAGELDFLRAVLNAPGVAASVDVVNVHSYFETWHPNPIERLPVYIAGAADVVRRSGGSQPLWMAETGYSSIGGRPEVSSVYRAHFEGEHTEDAQATALARTLLTALATEQLQLIAWYRINDLVTAQEVIGDDNNRHLGLRHADGSAKPALRAFAFLAGLFRQPYDVVTAKFSVQQAREAAPEVRVFRLRDGRWVVAAWLGMPAAPAGAEAMPDARAATVRVKLQGVPVRSFVVHDAIGQPLRDTGWSRGELVWSLRGSELRVAVLSP